MTYWLLYRRDCEDMGLPKKKQLPLLKFKYKIAEALFREEKNTLATSRKGRRSTSLDKAFEAKKPGVMLQKPYHSRLYEMTMWIIFPFIKRREADANYLVVTATILFCSKCQVHLCIARSKNCFLNFPKT